MIYGIVLIIIMILIRRIVYRLTEFDFLSMLVTLFLSTICALAFFVAIPNGIVKYTESETQSSVEEMDKSVVTIDGVKYDYELKYAEDSDVPYATLVEVDYPKWHKVLMVFKTNRTIAYVYTNDVAAINGD